MNLSNMRGMRQARFDFETNGSHNIATKVVFGNKINMENMV